MLRNAQLRRLGFVMGGGWRRPVRPFQVCCVLAGCSPTAAISQEFHTTACAGLRRPSARFNLVAPGERLTTTAAVSGAGGAANPVNAFDWPAAIDLKRAASFATLFDPARACHNDRRLSATVL